MSNQSAHISFWKTSDFMILVTLAFGLVLQYFFPDVIPFSMPDIIRYSIGSCSFALGILIIFMAKREFKKHAQPSGPGVPTTDIVTSGIFSRSRNPLYLGIVIAVFAAGFLFNNPWFVVLDAFLVLALHRLLILPEEQYLIATFSEQYLSYMKATRRWI
ncbi:MAG: isoprenylcysteine carboxylmethyltransferase family protein [Gammaproteobacteria bacterium]|nr:isoprenylcysteine carboxylmethyltransferase family protein [Gammaproteobacteria bacterium]